VKFGLMFANTMYSTADEARLLAEVAEDVGIESVWAVEHVFAPVDRTTPYPYSSDGDVDLDAELTDPVVWLSFMAAASRTLRLGTGVMILPQRHPAYVAKEWATLDRLSGGRAMLGVGLGWLVEEMEGIGVPFSERAPRLEESIAAIRSLWREEPSAFDGTYFRWPPMISRPKPSRPRGVPIIIGGHVERAARRAARLGDGFFWPGALGRKSAASGGFDGLRTLVGALRDECARSGRDPSEVEIMVGVFAPDEQTVDELREIGVSRIVVSPPRPANLRRKLERMAPLWTG
jgi:probable F420-dependent oxidoreductase